MPDGLLVYRLVHLALNQLGPVRFWEGPNRVYNLVVE